MIARQRMGGVAQPLTRASLHRLRAVQARLPSALTLASPRSKSWRKPRACVITPKTGWTVCLRGGNG